MYLIVRGGGGMEDSKTGRNDDERQTKEGQMRMERL